MAECVVASCRGRNCELFCAPDDKNKLKKWQMTIGTKLSEFLICENHFQKEFIITEKSLASNAFPSILLRSQDYQKESSCQSCLKQLSSSDERKLTDEKFVDIFKRLGFEIKKNSSLCKECYVTLSNFQNILTKQEMKKNNPPSIKIETIDIEDDQPEISPIKSAQPPLKPAPIIKEYKPKIIINPKMHSTPKEPQKEVPPPQIQQFTIQRNVQSPTVYSASPSKSDSDRIQVQNINPKIIKVPLKSIFKTVPQGGLQIGEYVIPLKDFPRAIEEPVKKPVIATMRRQSAAPMTIIHNTSPDKIMNNEVTSLKDDGPNNSDFNSIAKRRASIGNPTAVSQEIKSSPSSNLIRVLPSKEFRCSECLAPFATSRLLKYHEDNGLCDKRPQSTTSRALNSFKCFDCNNSFASYYFLRRHRETCTLSLRVKCTYQYCRFRATNPGEIQKHFNEVHAHKLKCKECDEVLQSQAALVAHEVLKHGREDVAKKRALKQRQARAAKRAKADLDFDANTLTECQQCSSKIPSRELSNHMMICSKK